MSELDIFNLLSITNASCIAVGLIIGIGCGIYINLIFYAKKNRDLGKPLTGVLCVALGLLGGLVGALMGCYAPT